MTADPNPRETNQRVATAYEAVPYEGPNFPDYEVDRLFGVGAVFGCERTGRDLDVLDLGCGRGAQVERAAERVTGRVVGADITATAIDIARARTARFGDRVTLHHTDLLDLSPDELGTFDVIYCLGVIHGVPEAVTDHLVTVIGRCLKPGGLAVITYYAGSTPKARAEIADLLRTTQESNASPPERIARARERLRQLRGEAASSPVPQPQLTAALDTLDRTRDSVLFHEALAGQFRVPSTPALTRAFEPFGVSFLDYLVPTPALGFPDAASRAAAVDTLDRAGGGFRHAVYAKDAGRPRGPDLGRVRWCAAYEPTTPARYDVPSDFRIPSRGQKVSVDSPRLLAMLHALKEGPATWLELLEASSRRLGAARIEPTAEDDARAARDFMRYYSWRVVFPVAF